MTTCDIKALCAAVDAGDDTVLCILADSLEEAGDPRAAGLRAARTYTPACGNRRGCVTRRWCWLDAEFHQRTAGRAAVPPAAYRRLLGKDRLSVWRPPGDGLQYHEYAKDYPTRSAAYLALAEASERG